MTRDIQGANETALSTDERAELERLRAEVAVLRASTPQPGAPAQPGRWRRRGRSALAGLLIALGCLLTPLSVVSVWARGEVTDTNRYVDTVAPLAEDPAVQQAMTDNITNLIFQYIDIDGLTAELFAALSERDVVPPRLAEVLPALAVPVANGVRSFTEDQVQNVVESDVFARAWAEANRAAHQQLVAALTGEDTGAVQVEGDAVRVNVAAFISAVKDRLIDRGFQLAERIPEVDAQFVIFQSADLPKVQRGFDLLNTLGVWMPIICLALIGLGIYLARNHRLAFIGAGIGVALAMLVTAIALILVRRAYLDGVVSDALPPDAAAVLYDTVVRYLREAIRAGALLGVVVAAGAFLTGPSVTARAIRRWVVTGFAWARGGLRRAGVGLEAAGAWVARYARVLRVAVVLAAFAVLLLQRYRTPELVAWLTVGVLLALGIIEFFAAPSQEATDEEALPVGGPGRAVPAEP